MPIPADTNDKPRLSIGIPTYNFGSTIGETLASIAAAMREGVEIVIVDAGSSDATPEIVANWSARLPIRYHRKTTRDGIDVDIALTVKLAQSDYCWLLSADDTISETSIADVLTEIANRPDVVLLSHSNCDERMRPIRDHHPVLAGKSRNIKISTDSDRHAYFSDARTTEALFSFLSGLVVKRERWDVHADMSRLRIGSCWSHVVRLLLRMRDGGLTIIYHDKPLVARRGDNDSFATRGIVARYALGIDGYLSIVTEIFGPHSIELSQTRRILRAEFTPLMFLYAKRAATLDSVKEDKMHLDGMFNQLYARKTGFALARFAYSLPAAPALWIFESLNKVRHRFIGRPRR